MTAQQQTIDRMEAARVLRAARRAAAEKADEAIDWSFACMPDRRGPCRLKIQRLLDQGNTEAADALIGQGLLQRPNDPSLGLLRARSLATQGLLTHADRGLRQVLSQRPEHVGALTLAAEVASQQMNHPRAVQFLEQALRRRPHDDGIKATLVGALIEVESLHRAEVVLVSMTPHPPALASRLRRAQGRPLDAVNLLRKALQVTANTARRDELLVALIEAMEEIGDVRGIQSVVAQATEDHPRARLGAARALMSQGNFRTATELIASTAQRPQWRRQALHHLVVTVTQIGRHDLARQSLQELNATSGGVDHRLMSECWLRAFRGRIIRRQRNAQQAGRDPSLTMLQPMLTDAVLTLEMQLLDDKRRVHGAEREELERCRGLCLAALGRSEEAAASFIRTARR